MPSYIADKLEIEIENERWQIFQGNTGTRVSPLFEYRRGDNVMHYHPDFGAAAGLPGNQLSISFVRAVVVGYHKSKQKWILGLHLADSSEAKPKFHPLVQWGPAPSEENIVDVREVARRLALLVTAPLKVFGEVKLPTQTTDPNRSGYTGPLPPHARKRMPQEEVARLAKQINLPIKGQGFSLTKARQGYQVKISKHMAAAGDDTPVFNLVDFNGDKKLIRLVPPTGFLGSFVQSAAQEIAFKDVYNIECRHVVQAITENVQTDDKLMTQQLMTNRHTWSGYLTVKDQSILLYNATFTQNPELMQKRITTVSHKKVETSSIEGIQYFREHMEEQEQLDAAQDSVLHTCVILADFLGCQLVETKLEI